mgnify:CR=1 FL=1
MNAWSLLRRLGTGDATGDNRGVVNWAIMRSAVVFAGLILASAAPADERWVRGGADGTQCRWGIAGGLQFAIPPTVDGPRGLIRLLYPTLPDGRYDLVNFIAIEPIVGGRRGYSELENSDLDRAPGKRFWVDDPQRRGTIDTPSPGIERLRVIVHVERVDNGAEVRLLLEQRTDRPDEVAITILPEPASADMQHCILTATMGNKARARILWLAGRTVRSLDLYPDYRDVHFAPPTTFPWKELAVNGDGDLVVAITTDEANPADARPFPDSDAWYWGGQKVTQYWRMPRGTWADDLHAAVNARFTYWQSRQPIPGGIAFENFELRERFRPGQQFIFGITRRTPGELGIGPAKPPVVTNPTAR